MKVRCATCPSTTPTYISLLSALLHRTLYFCIGTLHEYNISTLDVNHEVWNHPVWMQFLWYIQCKPICEIGQCSVLVDSNRKSYKKNYKKYLRIRSEFCAWLLRSQFWVKQPHRVPLALRHRELENKFKGIVEALVLTQENLQGTSNTLKKQQDTSRGGILQEGCSKVC